MNDFSKRVHLISDKQDNLLKQGQDLINELKAIKKQLKGK